MSAAAAKTAALVSLTKLFLVSAYSIMAGIHSDSEFLGAAYHRGQDGDVRRGTCYGYRSAREYNRAVVAHTEKLEGRPVTLLYSQKLKNDDFVEEFVVYNGQLDPGMKVISRIPGETRPQVIGGDPALGTARVVDVQVSQEWFRLEMDGRFVFLPPDSYKGGPIIWLHRGDLLEERLVHEQTSIFWFPSEKKQIEVA
jgi:hypothetical protein